MYVGVVCKFAIHLSLSANFSMRSLELLRYVLLFFAKFDRQLLNAARYHLKQLCGLRRKEVADRYRLDSC